VRFWLKLDNTGYIGLYRGKGQYYNGGSHDSTYTNSKTNKKEGVTRNTVVYF
jgi:hypothetical protein